MKKYKMYKRVEVSEEEYIKTKKEYLNTLRSDKEKMRSRYSECLRKIDNKIFNLVTELQKLEG